MPVPRQISQSQQSNQQKFYVTSKPTPSTTTNIVKIQQSNPSKIYIQSAPKPVFVTTSSSQEDHELDDLSHLE